jgi:hypothetical protein
MSSLCGVADARSPHSRSQVPAALKTSTWAERRAKEQKVASVRKLQQEMADEKKADLAR